MTEDQKNRLLDIINQIPRGQEYYNNIAYFISLEGIYEDKDLFNIFHENNLFLDIKFIKDVLFDSNICPEFFNFINQGYTDSKKFINNCFEKDDSDVLQPFRMRKSNINENYEEWGIENTEEIKTLNNNEMLQYSDLARFLSEDGWQLQHMSDEIKNNKDLVIIAVTENGDAIQFVSDNLKSDIDVCDAAFLGNPKIIPEIRVELSEGNEIEEDNYVEITKQHFGIKNVNCLQYFRNFLNEEQLRKYNYLIKMAGAYDFEDSGVDFLEVCIDSDSLLELMKSIVLEEEGYDVRYRSWVNALIHNASDNKNIFNVFFQYEIDLDHDTRYVINSPFESLVQYTIYHSNNRDWIEFIVREKPSFFNYCSDELGLDIQFIIQIVRNWLGDEASGRENHHHHSDENFKGISKKLVKYISNYPEDVRATFDDLLLFRSDFFRYYFVLLPENIKIELAQNQNYIKAILTKQKGMNLRYFIGRDLPIEFIRVAIINNPYNCKYVARLNNFNDIFDFELWNVVVSRDGELIQYLPEEYKNNREIIINALKSSGEAIQFLPLIYHSDFEIIKHAIFRFSENGEIEEIKNWHCINLILNPEIKQMCERIRCTLFELLPYLEPQI
ncbi:MAG: DUF4116 domain-containing protein [Bacteroidetes bacterium]|nr:DUF4116 domain-containing protein [Bacteroidota bacterium]